MSKSKSSGKNMISLVMLLNDLWAQTKNWNIAGWDEVSGKKFTISVDFNEKTISLEKGKDAISNLDILSFAWHAGIIDANNEEEIKKTIEDKMETKSNRTVAIALDTNLVINRFYPNYMERYHSEPYKRKPHFLVLSAAIDHELHYKMASTIGHDSTFASNLIRNHAGDPLSYLLLSRNHQPASNQSHEPLYRVASRNSRLGIKGIREMRRLQQIYPVILSQPSHIYYSEKIQTTEKFVDAVFDSLIRYEAHFLEKNTNIDLVFLTSDKQQFDTANTEALTTQYVAPPTHPSMLQSISPDRFKVQNIARFVEELIVFSPLAIIESGSRNIRLACAWEGMGPGQIREGLLRGIIDKEEIWISCE